MPVAAEMDYPGFCGERLTHFAGPALECDGAQEAKRRVPPDGVIEPVDVSGHGIFGLLTGLSGDRPDQIRPGGLDERLDHRVIVGVSGEKGTAVVS